MEKDVWSALIIQGQGVGSNYDDDENSPSWRERENIRCMSDGSCSRGRVISSDQPKSSTWCVMTNPPLEWKSNDNDDEDSLIWRERIYQLIDHADRDVWSAVISQSHPASILTCDHWSACHWLTDPGCDIIDHLDWSQWPTVWLQSNTSWKDFSALNVILGKFLWSLKTKVLPSYIKVSEVALKYMRLDTGAIIWLSVVHCPMPHCATSVDPLSIPRTAGAQLTHGWVYQSVQTKMGVGFWIGKSQNYPNIQIVGKKL